MNEETATGLGERLVRSTQQGYGYLERLRRPALWLFVLVCTATIVFGLLDIDASSDPPYLLLSLNILFLGIPAFFIAAISIRGYLRTGVWAVLWLGIGTLTFGLATIMGGILLQTANVNAAITVHNVIAFLAASLYLLGAFFVSGKVSIQLGRHERRTTVLEVYLAAVVFMVFVTIISIRELLPPFFAEGEGGTSLRQILVGTTILLLLLAGLSTTRHYLQSRSHLLYWYSLGLLLLSLGMGGILMQTSTGSPLNWTGRGAQLLGGMYLLVTAVVSIREARTRDVPVGEAMADSFTRIEVELRESEARFRIVFERAEMGIAVGDMDGRVTEANPALERMLGYQGEELRNKHFSEFTHPDDTAVEWPLVQETLAGRRPCYEIEKRYIRKDGQVIWVRLIGSVVRGDKGQPLFSVALIDNITDRKKTEVAMGELLASVQREREKLSALLSSIPDEVWFADTQKNFTLANPAALREFGFSMTGGMGVESLARILEVYRPDGTARPPKEAPPLRALEGETVRSQEEIVRTPVSRELRWRQVSAAPVADSNGKIIGSVSVVRDITAHKMAEEALQKQQQELEAKNLQLQALFDYSNASLALFDAQRPYTVLAHNEYYQHLWNEPFCTEGMVGKNLLDYVPEIEASGVMAIFDEVVRTREPKNLVSFPYDGMSCGRTWWNWHLSPILQGGRVIALAHVAFDITKETVARQELEKSAASLRETRDYLDNLFNCANAPIIVWNPELEVTRFNHAFERLTGSLADKVLGKRLDVLFPDDSREASLDLISRTASGERWETVEIPILHRSGAVRIVLWNSASLYASDGKTPVATIAQGQDITERKRAEDRLQRYMTELEVSNKELEAFAYSVSHDLREPLRTLDGFSQAVLEDNADKLDANGKDYLTRIRGAAEHMAAITEGMLKLSRVIRSELQIQMVDLSGIALSIAEDLTGRLKERKVEFIIAKGIVINGDASLLQLALRNLFENSWKFTAKLPQARIEFGITQQDNQKVYFVRDNGVGFNMKYADKLFRPFQRLHADLDYQGTGIGLATVQRVIRRHGGEIWAESDIGQGTTIYFTLLETRR